MTNQNSIQYKKKKNNKREQLWFAIRLSHFPLESLNIQRHNTNIMVSYKNHICATTDNLYAQGIERGTPTSTAQLLVIPDGEIPCRIYERECNSEKKSLIRICEALYNITPHIETYAVNTPNGCEDVGLLLEISRCIALFKGVDAIEKEINKTLKRLKFSYDYALGHNKNIAWLLSYSHPIKPPKHSTQYFIEALKPLSLDHLYEYQDTIAQLKKTGFFCFGDLIHHIEQSSSHSLRKRFGGKFSDYISEILGIENCMQQHALFKKPAATYQPKQLFSESIQFDYPVSNCEQLEHPIKTLLTTLTQELVKNQEQTQNVCWNLYDIYHQHKSFSVNFERLHNDSQLAHELTMIQLENQPLPFEVDTLELRCENVLPVHFENRPTHNDPHHDSSHNSNHDLHFDSHYEMEKNAIAIVTSKLNARLGENSVQTLSPKDSHIPELTFTKTPMASAQNLSPEVPSATKTDRPSWIFNIPIKIGKRQNTLYWKGSLELQQGPERIEGLWWKKPTGRDYFVAKRDDHVRLWVFHDLYKNAWFVQGVFA